MPLFAHMAKDSQDAAVFSNYMTAMTNAPPSVKTDWSAKVNPGGRSLVELGMRQLGNHRPGYGTE